MDKKTTASGKIIDQKMVEVMLKGLKDFGYIGLDFDRVETYVDRAIVGEKPVGGPEMFVHNWLKEAGLL